MTPPFKGLQRVAFLLGTKVCLTNDAAEGWDSPITAIQGSFSKLKSHHSGQFALNQRDICQCSDEALHAQQPLISLLVDPGSHPQATTAVRMIPSSWREVAGAGAVS